MSFLALAIASVSACARSVTLVYDGKRAAGHLYLILSFEVHAKRISDVQFQWNWGEG
jgi:hypothetical protein